MFANDQVAAKAMKNKASDGGLLKYKHKQKQIL